MDGSTIVNRINALLAEKGIQKQDFYKNCGITSASYSLWNTGKTNPRMKNLETIAAYLGTTTDYLLTGLGKKEKAPTIQTDSEQIQLEGTYLRLAQGAQELGLDDEDVDTILAIYSKHKQRNQ